MDKKILLIGVIVLVVGLVIIAAGYAIVDVQANKYRKDYDEKCSGLNSTKETQECLNLNADMVAAGVQFMALSCGGIIAIIIGIVVTIWGLVKKEAPAPGHYPPAQYPPQYPQQYPQAYPPQAPPPVYAPPPAYQQPPPQGQPGYYQQPPQPGAPPPGYPPPY